MFEGINPGDSISLTYEEEKGKTTEFSGVLLPRSPLLDQDIIILKLSSGYNIGLKKSLVTSASLVKAYEKPAVTTEEDPVDPKLPTVSLLSTGGTISSKIDYRTGGVYADYTAHDFVMLCPELKSVANLRAKNILTVMSEDMYATEWKQAAQAVYEECQREDITGVVVTCGTDTLHYFTAALSFFLPELNKPVIVTAAQRSIDRGSSDAFMNLICAVKAAATFDGGEVVSCLHGTIDDEFCYLIRGTKVRKMHTSRRDAFRPVNDTPLAKVPLKGELEVLSSSYRKQANQVVLDVSFEEKVGQLLWFPGQDPGIIDHYISNGYKGLVIHGSALGHVSVNGSTAFLPALKKAKEAGIVLVMASQTLYGRVNPNVYSNLRELSLGLGVIFAEDMMPEVAYLKLAHLLGKGYSEHEVSELMQKNLVGEIKTHHQKEDFLF